MTCAYLNGIEVNPGFHGDPTGDPVEPACRRVLTPDRARPPGEDEEGRLEGVLGLVSVAEHAPADAEDHRSVAEDQHPEGSFLPPPSFMSQASFVLKNRPANQCGKSLKSYSRY